MNPGKKTALQGMPTDTEGGALEGVLPQPGRLLSDGVYAQLRALLGTPGFEPHARLPAEHALAARFGVSRPVLRQALARLRTEERIYSRKGSGSYVGQVPIPALDMSFGAFTSIPDIRSFLEFRCSLEGEAAARAALHHTADDLREIIACRKRFEEALRSGKPGIQEDVAFHQAVAQASGNRYFQAAIAALGEQTRFSIGLVRKLASSAPRDRFAQVCREHAAIQEAIAGRNAETARRAMLAHLHGGITRLFDV